MMVRSNYVCEKREINCVYPCHRGYDVSVTHGQKKRFERCFKPFPKSNPLNYPLN